MRPHLPAKGTSESTRTHSLKKKKSTSRFWVLGRQILARTRGAPAGPAETSRADLRRGLRRGPALPERGPAVAGISPASDLDLTDAGTVVPAAGGGSPAPKVCAGKPRTKRGAAGCSGHRLPSICVRPALAGLASRRGGLNLGTWRSRSSPESARGLFHGSGETGSARFGSVAGCAGPSGVGSLSWICSADLSFLSVSAAESDPEDRYEVPASASRGSVLSSDSLYIGVSVWGELWRNWLLGFFFLFYGRGGTFWEFYEVTINLLAPPPGVSSPFLWSPEW